MTPSIIQSELATVLEDIQRMSGLECPKLEPTTKPLTELPNFDSTIWPVAVAMLGQRLKFRIADNINIFSENNEPLSIAQIVQKVARLAPGMAPSAGANQ